ncbi:MAG: hypothetical protein QXR73_02355, partial [Candidatus Micrarchaeaceae archaeon]
MSANQVAKLSDSETAYEPDLYTKEEIAEFPWIFKNKKEDAYVLAVNKGIVGTYLKGFVESKSRKGMYHYVVELINPKMIIMNG